VAELCIQSVINDERWAFVKPLLPTPRRPQLAHRRVDPRAAFAAVVYGVLTDTAWYQIPSVFGISRSTVNRHFLTYTDADLWRKLAVAAVDTPHATLALTVADAAIRRAGHHAPGCPHPEPVAEQPTDDEPAAADEPARRRYVRYSTDDYDIAREALNRHDGTAL
jgi:transposase